MGPGVIATGRPQNAATSSTPCRRASKSTTYAVSGDWGSLRASWEVRGGTSSTPPGARRYQAPATRTSAAPRTATSRRLCSTVPGADRQSGEKL